MVPRRRPPRTGGKRALLAGAAFALLSCAPAYAQEPAPPAPPGPDGLQRDEMYMEADEVIRPGDVEVRLPVDWDSVDPIPPALAEIMARPGTVNPPLDDVVPGEPEPASMPVGGAR